MLINSDEKAKNFVFASLNQAAIGNVCLHILLKQRPQQYNLCLCNNKLRFADLTSLQSKEIILIKTIIIAVACTCICGIRIKSFTSEITVRGRRWGRNKRRGEGR